VDVMVGAREAILSQEMKAACGEWWEEERFPAPPALQYQPWNHYVLSLCKKEIAFFFFFFFFKIFFFFFERK